MTEIRKEDIYINSLKKTSYDIENFTNEVIAKPGDDKEISNTNLGRWKGVDVDNLLASIEESQNSIYNYENTTGKIIYLNPNLKDDLNLKIDEAIKHLSDKIKWISSKNHSDVASPYLRALSALQQFQTVINDFRKKEVKIERKESPGQL